MRSGICVFLLSCILLLLTGPAQAVGVENIDMIRSRFFADVASFADSGANRVEVYYKIFNDGLHYVQKCDKYVANYEINVIVMGEGDRQVTAQSIDKTYILDEYELTQSQQGFLVNQIDLKLEPGKYALICKLIDHNSKDVSNVETKFESLAFDPAGSLSDIEFLQDVGEVEGESKFLKRGQTTVPAVERSFDSEAQRLGFYVECYLGEDVGKRLSLSWKIESRHGNGLEEGSLPLVGDQRTIGVSEYLDLAALAPGEYEFELALLDGKRRLAARSTRLFVRWSLASLVKNDFEYAVEQLKYIHTRDERNELKEAPDSLRLAKFEEIWDRKDPTPGTTQNELRDEYYSSKMEWPIFCLAV